MKVQVSCFATLSDYAPADGYIDLPKGAVLEDVFSLLSIPLDEVKIVFVNGQSSSKNAVLQEGDRVGLFPAIGGG